MQPVSLAAATAAAVVAAGAHSSDQTDERSIGPRNVAAGCDLNQLQQQNQQTLPETPLSAAPAPTANAGQVAKDERRPSLFIAIPVHTHQQRGPGSAHTELSPNVFQFPDARAGDGGPVSPPPSLGSSLPAQSVLLRSAAAHVAGGLDDVPLPALSPRAVSLPKGAGVVSWSPSNSRPVSTTSVELEVRTYLLALYRYSACVVSDVQLISLYSFSNSLALNSALCLCICYFYCFRRTRSC